MSYLRHVTPDVALCENKSYEEGKACFYLSVNKTMLTVVSCYGESCNYQSESASEIVHNCCVCNTDFLQHPLELAT